MRLFQSAYEFGRNRDRFQAAAGSLERALGRLDTASDANSAAGAIRNAEEALASEHREWLRLMRHAEWYG